MKVDPQCSYCLLSRVHYESELSTDNEILIDRIMQECIQVLNDTYAPGVPAASVSTSMHRRAYELLNDSDPYRDMKDVCNRTAEKVFPIARSMVYDGGPSDNELFRRAVLAAVIGNFFDFGVMGLEVPISLFDETFRQHFARGLDIDDTPKMLDMLDNVVYVADNCGEILLDTLVFDIIKELGGHVTLVVRGEPILTDVTMKDVIELGIDGKVDRVLTTGSGSIGVDMEQAPQELLNAFRDASLIISKGMANYETLTEHEMGPIAYLLKAKCKPVARHIGVDVGHSVARLFEQ